MSLSAHYAPESSNEMAPSFNSGYRTPADLIQRV